MTCYSLVLVDLDGFDGLDGGSGVTLVFSINHRHIDINRKNAKIFFKKYVDE